MRISSPAARWILCGAIVVAMATSSLGQSATPTHRAPKKPAAVEAPAPQPATQESDAAGKARQERAARMLADIQKMRNILDQMDRNKAFAAPGETPLKHQFDLEIDMWRALLDDMQAQANNLAQPARIEKQNP